MVRSMFIVVSDDQAVVQKAHQFGQMHGVTVTVHTPEQWHAQQNHAHDTHAVPSLVAGQAAGHMTGEGAKVLPFPGTQMHGAGLGTSVGGERRGVATINQLEASAIENAIGAFKGNLTEAAKALGIGRATLYRKVKQYNIDPSAARNKKKAA